MWETLWIGGKEATGPQQAQAFRRRRTLVTVSQSTWPPLGKVRDAEYNRSVI